MSVKKLKPTFYVVDSFQQIAKTDKHGKDFPCFVCRVRRIMKHNGEPSDTTEIVYMPSEKFNIGDIIVERVRKRNSFRLAESREIIEFKFEHLKRPGKNLLDLLLIRRQLGM